VFSINTKIAAWITDHTKWLVKISSPSSTTQNIFAISRHFGIVHTFRNVEVIIFILKNDHRHSSLNDGQRIFIFTSRKIFFPIACPFIPTWMYGSRVKLEYFITCIQHLIWHFVTGTYSTYSVRWEPSCTFHQVTHHQPHHPKYIGIVYQTKKALKYISLPQCVLANCTTKINIMYITDAQGAGVGVHIQTIGFSQNSSLSKQCRI